MQDEDALDMVRAALQRNSSYYTHCKTCLCARSSGSVFGKMSDAKEHRDADTDPLKVLNEIFPLRLTPKSFCSTLTHSYK